MPENLMTGLMAILPVCGFLSLLKIHCRGLGLNPRTLGPMVSTLRTRAPRMTWKCIVAVTRSCHLQQMEVSGLLDVQ